jgi:hypothetical protein
MGALKLMKSTSDRLSSKAEDAQKTVDITEVTGPETGASDP